MLFTDAKSSWTTNELAEIFSETFMLLLICLTTPVSSAVSERCFSTLKRIKTFPENTMTNDRLNALAVLFVQKDLIRGISEFNSKVIGKFARQKNRRIDFIYEEITREQAL